MSRDNTIQLNKEIVQEGLQVINKVTQKGFDDLDKFEKVISLLLTEENCKESKIIARLAEVHEPEALKRKAAFESVVESLNGCKKALQHMAELFEITI